MSQATLAATKTTRLPKINQDRLKKSTRLHSLPSQVEMWSPITSGPVLVPVTRWIE